MSSGERFPLIIGFGERHPAFEPTAYLLRDCRPRGLAFNTLKGRAEAIRFLLTWARSVGIDLTSRLAEGWLLQLHEIEDLAGAARLGFKALSQQSSKPKARVTRPISLERTLQRTSPVEEGISSEAAATRIRYMADYLEWLVKAQLYRTPGRIQSAPLASISPMDVAGLLRARAPQVAQRNPDTERQGLPEEVQKRLLSASAPSASDNPFESEFIRDRNELMVLLFYHLGLRQGELLKFKIDKAHFDARKGILRITRSPDDPTDPRDDAPQAKTNARALPLSDVLTQRVLDHITKHRRHRKHSKSHDFLFVSVLGRPLSKSSVNKIFITLREKVDGLQDGLSPHYLRHTFNENLSDMFDASGTSDENEKRIRAYLNGWSDQSDTAATYLRRRTRERAQKIGVSLQEKLHRGTDHE